MSFLRIQQGLLSIIPIACFACMFVSSVLVAGDGPHAASPFTIGNPQSSYIGEGRVDTSVSASISGDVYGVSEMEYLGSSLWVNRYSVVMNESRLFFGMTNGIEIVEFTDNQTLRIDSRVFLDCRVLCLLLCDSVLFAGTSEGRLIALEVVDGTGLRYISEVQTNYAIRGISERDNVLFVATGEYLKIVDASDLADMQVVGELDTGYGAGSYQAPQDVVVLGDVAYVSADDIWVIDVSSISAPTLIYVEPTAEMADDLELRDSILFVSSNSACSPSCGSFYQIYAIKDSDSLEFHASVPTEANVLSSAVQGDYAYVAMLNSGAAIVDISDTYNPSIVGCFPHFGFARRIICRDSLAFVLNSGSPPSIDHFQFPVCDSLSVTVDSSFYTIADTGSFAVFDVTDPTALVPIAATRFPGALIDVATDDRVIVAVDEGWGFIHVAESKETLSEAEFTRIRCPDETGISTQISDVCIHGNYAFVADSYTGLRSIDVSDPSDPHLVGTLRLPSLTADVTVTDIYALVSNGANGVRFVDISDPAHMVEVGSLATGDFALESMVSGHYAYVADRFAGAKIIDFQDVTSPVLVSEYNTSLVNDIALQDNLLAICGSGSIELFSIADDPRLPVFLGSYIAMEPTRNIELHGRLLIISHIRQGVEIVDVSDPAMPVLVAFKSTPGYPNGVAVTNHNTLLLADNFSLLEYELPVVSDIQSDNDIELPSDFVLSQNYPNPFNPSTTIQFALPIAGQTSLTIYNVLGEKVKTLIDKPLPAGSYHVEWDGTDESGNDCASGVYLYRLIASDQTLSKKMVLLR